MSEVFDDILVLDTETESLSTLETEAEGMPSPPRLSRHSMAAMGGSLWMVGGWDGVECGWIQPTASTCEPPWPPPLPFPPPPSAPSPSPSPPFPPSPSSPPLPLGTHRRRSGRSSMRMLATP